MIEKSIGSRLSGSDIDAFVDVVVSDNETGKTLILKTLLGPLCPCCNNEIGSQVQVEVTEQNLRDILAWATNRKI